MGHFRVHLCLLFKVNLSAFVISSIKFSFICKEELITITKTSCEFFPFKNRTAVFYRVQKHLLRVFERLKKHSTEKRVPRESEQRFK